MVRLYTRKQRKSVAFRTAARAIVKSRSTPMQIEVVGTRPLAPLRTGGFFGVNTRRRLAEKKTIDVDPTTNNVTTTPVITLLNGAATGTDFTDRIGRKIIMRSLYVKGVIYPEDDITTESILRCIIVYDMQANGAAPVITDVLKSSAPLSQLNLNNRDRFKVLYDKHYIIGKTNNTATQAVSNGHNLFQFKKFIRLRHEVLFSGTTAAIGSIQTGSLYFIFLSSTAAGSSPNITWSSRIRFEDQ